MVNGLFVFLFFYSRPYNYILIAMMIFTIVEQKKF